MHLLALLLALSAQRPDSLAAQVREYVAVDTALLALTHVLIVDGTGGAPKSDQTIVIRAGRITAVGPAGSLQGAPGGPGGGFGGLAGDPRVGGRDGAPLLTPPGGPRGPSCV